MVNFVCQAQPCNWSQLHPSNQCCSSVVKSCMITKFCECDDPAYSATFLNECNGKVVLCLLYDIVIQTLTWNQSMVQQFTSEGNFLNLFLNASPIGLMASTMCIC